LTGQGGLYKSSSTNMLKSGCMPLIRPEASSVEDYRHNLNMPLQTLSRVVEEPTITAMKNGHAREIQALTA